MMPLFYCNIRKLLFKRYAGARVLIQVLISTPAVYRYAGVRVLIQVLISTHAGYRYA